MTPRSSDPAPGERLFRLLLRVYPAAFRDRVGDDMVDFYRDRWREHRALGGGAVTLWFRVLGDLAAHAPAEHLAERARRRIPSPLPHQERDPMSSRHLRLAMRSLSRRPGFVAVVLATLALGIGANAAIFSVVNGILLRPLPFREPERVVRVTLADPYSQLAEMELYDLRRDMRAVTSIAGYSGADATITGGAEPDRVTLARVTDQFFSTLGASPAMGRTFTAEEERPGGPRAIILSDALWKGYLGGRKDIVGSKIDINGVPRTVIGVMPPRFDYPASEVAGWVPMRLNPDSLDTRNNHVMIGVARLRPGATVEAARTEMTTLVARWKRDFPDIYGADTPIVPRVDPIVQAIVGDTRPFLLALMGAVGFVLLIACVNVANLLITRGESRRRELAVRAALGASRTQLAQQVLAEGALLAIGGGVLGLVAAWAATRGLLALAPSNIPRLDEVRIDPAVLAFTGGVSLLSGLLAALVPAVRAARGAPAQPLREGGRGAATSVATRRTRSALVVAQVALAVVTLSGAGLMLRSLWKIQATDLGFSPDHVLTARVSPISPNDPSVTDATTAQRWREILDRVSAVPGVRSAAAATTLPVANEDDSRWSILLDGRVLKNISESPSAKPVHVTPDFFRTLGIHVVRGRPLLPTDREGAPAVMVVNETMARQMWPNRDPLGHTVRLFGRGEWATVVGVVRDVRSGGFQAEVPPTFYVAHAQGTAAALYTPWSMTLAVRTTGDPAALAPALRRAIRAAAPAAPITQVRTMNEIVSGSIASRRFTTTLLGVFAGVALVLAGIGIYGVVAYLVAQRTNELGLRVALGAPRGAVVGLVLRQGMRLTGVGLVVGVAFALVLTRLVRSLLVEVSAVDPPTFAAVVLGLLGVGLLACAVPARRALAVSPTQALRAE
ncbi:permease (plasmid) [Gemmatirosa kalamazoonensis]|uniref:Permease n=1 Tax=Gemmatirosa kalamazoonensis TaxID=861299 RepID=W0RTT5_9BACT|nr:ABC transporter permease [Gemmatirosa kalamazoonensis]AHG93877.1 permease [Gemmatirosa kalamazoonensis]